VLYKSLVLAVLAMAVLSCDHPPPETCEKACWKYAELNYWGKIVPERLAKATSEEDKKAIQAASDEEWAKITKWDIEKDPELRRCYLTCTKEGSPEQTECVLKAEKFEEMKDCGRVGTGMFSGCVN
jgi:hypothetical protein